VGTVDFLPEITSDFGVDERFDMGVGCKKISGISLPTLSSRPPTPVFSRNGGSQTGLRRKFGLFESHFERLNSSPPPFFAVLLEAFSPLSFVQQMGACHIIN
jgi:hypothetical protein